MHVKADKIASNYVARMKTKFSLGHVSDNQNCTALKLWKGSYQALYMDFQHSLLSKVLFLDFEHSFQSDVRLHHPPTTHPFIDKYYKKIINYFIDQLIYLLIFFKIDKLLFLNNIYS